MINKLTIPLNHIQTRLRKKLSWFKLVVTTASNKEAVDKA